MKTPYSFKFLYNQLLSTLKPRINAYDSFSYVSHLDNGGSIRKIQQLYAHSSPQNLETHIPVSFAGIGLTANLLHVRKTLGTPYFKRLKYYGNHELKTLVYKQDFCGIGARAFIQLLDGDIVNCSYRIDLNGRNTIQKIKDIIIQKYQLQDIDLGNNFTLSDPFGGKLIFENEFELTLTYFSTSNKLQQVVNDVLSHVEHYKARMNTEQVGKLAYAF
jgi:hypothetical protein